MDATNNDVPATFKVHGYPTLYWAPANNKQNPVKYEVGVGMNNTFSLPLMFPLIMYVACIQGGRELKDLLSYVAKHASEELEGYDRDGKSKTGKDEL